MTQLWYINRAFDVDDHLSKWNIVCALVKVGGYAHYNLVWQYWIWMNMSVTVLYNKIKYNMNDHHNDGNYYLDHILFVLISLKIISLMQTSLTLWLFIHILSLIRSKLIIH